MTRAAGYLRVSSDRQADSDRNSLPLQKLAIEDRCRERGHELVALYTDVLSGRKNARPQYQAMLAAARRGEFDVLVFTYLDRFGRNDREITLRVLELQEAGIEIDPTQETIGDFITLTLTAWKAGAEVQRTRERTIAGLLAAARKAVPLGKVPYGYRSAWEYNEHGRKTNIHLVIYEPEARWVRWAFEAYAERNESFRAIAWSLTASAAPKKSGGAWHPREVAQLLERERYTGTYIYRDVVIPDAIPAIVSRDLFEAAQHRRDEKANLSRGRVQASPFLLAGIARCGHCDGPMYGRRAPYPRLTGGPRVEAFYSCGNHSHLGAMVCPYPNQHMAHFLEDAVTAFLNEIAGDVEPVREQVAERSTEHHERLLGVKHALADVEAKFIRNMRMYEAGAIASDAQQRTLEHERDCLLEAISANAQRQQEIRSLPEEAPRLLDPALPIGERKTIVQRYIARVTIRAGEKIPTIYPRFFE